MKKGSSWLHLSLTALCRRFQNVQAFSSPMFPIGLAMPSVMTEGFLRAKEEVEAKAIMMRGVKCPSSLAEAVISGQLL